MKNLFLILFSILLSAFAMGQHQFSLYERGRKAPEKDVEVQVLTQDSLASTSIIWITKGVRAHFHKSHTEHVVVISGTGNMKIDEEEFQIKEGDLIFIPSGSVHEVHVTSEEDLKVLSIQAPLFLGTDRIFVQAKKGG